MRFTVIDTQTGTTPDVKKIAREEPWASGLIWMDIDGFARDAVSPG